MDHKPGLRAAQICAKSIDGIGGMVEVETYLKATPETVARVTAISLATVPVGADRQPVNPGQVQLVPIGSLKDQGGKLHRTEDGRLALTMPMGRGLELVNIGDCFLYTNEPLPAAAAGNAK